MKLPDIVDSYSRRARLRPALLALFPALVTIAALFPKVYANAGAVVASLAATCGVLALLAHGARYLGRKKEIELYAQWGGIPTTAWLRHRDDNLDPATKKRYHAFLSKHVPNLKLPTAKQEAADPDAADAAYRSATKWLLEHTRDKKKFSLLFEENVSYGFQRNTLGLKPIGLAVSIGSLGLTALVIRQRYGDALDQVDGGAWLSLVVSAAAAIGWVTIVSPNWVRDAANAYARALLAACEQK